MHNCGVVVGLGGGYSGLGGVEGGLGGGKVVIRGVEGGLGGLGAGGGVFEDEAVGGLDAEAGGGGEEGVGVRFAAVVVLGGDDGIEEVVDTEGVQGAHDEVAVTAGGDGHGLLAVVAADEFDDVVHGFDLRDHFAVVMFLALHDLVDVEGQTESGVEAADDFRGGHASPFVEKFLRVGSAEVGHGAAPCPVVEGHVVGQRAVAVEDEGAEVTRGQGQRGGHDEAGGLKSG